MRRRVRLTESQLRGVVEEASRRVIQEMIDEGFFNWLGNVAGNVVQGATNAYNGAVDWGKNAANTVANAATNAYNNTVDWGKNAANTVANTAVNAYNGAVNLGNQAYNAAKQGIKQAGNDFSSGYQQGRQNQQPAYLTAIQQYYNKQKAQRK